MAGPKSNTYIGRYDEAVSEIAEIVNATNPTSDANRGRRVSLALLESLEGIAKAHDTVNVSFHYSPTPQGQLNLTAVLTLTPSSEPAEPVAGIATGT